MNKKIHIVYYNQISEISGAEVSLLALMSRLNSGKFRITLLCPSDGPLPTEAHKLGIDTISVPALRIGYRLRLHLLFFYVLRFLTVVTLFSFRILRLRPDVVHANSIRAGIIACLSLIPPRTRILVHIRDSSFAYKDILAKVILSLFALRAHKVVAISDWIAVRCAQMSRSRLGRKIITVYNGVDIKLFNPKKTDSKKVVNELGLTDNYPRIGIIGQITPLKGQMDVVKAMPLILEQFPTAKLLIVGEAKFLALSARYDNSQYEEQLHHFVEKLNLSEKVIFAGQRNDVPQIIKSLDMLISASWTEGFCRPVVEAMAMERPVITTRSGGPNSIVEEGVTGIFVKTKDPSDIARAVLTLANNPERDRRMGRAGRRRVIERFTVYHYVNAVESIYNEIA